MCACVRGEVCIGVCVMCVCVTCIIRCVRVYTCASFSWWC